MRKRDKIRYTIRQNGEVMLARAETLEDDSVLGPLLGFLARDIVEHPERCQTVDESLVTRINSLVGRIDVDLDAPLSAHAE